jgi:DNA invertase Pin-like site-specific DNA recombinase
MMGVFAEFERAMIQERVRAGLARAKSEGKRLGRPRIAPELEQRIQRSRGKYSRSGRAPLTDAEASAITEEASITRKHLKADNLARFLGVTYAQRQALRLTTIGSIDVKKRARKELRKRRDRIARERKRRALGMRPQSESLSATQPSDVACHVTLGLGSFDRSAKPSY